MRRETPVQWLKPLEAKGLHSARDLAVALEVAPQTAIRLLHGGGVLRETIEAAADLLGLTVSEVKQLRGEVALPPFVLPAEADRLTVRQRDAILGVVRAFLEVSNDRPATTEADDTPSAALTPAQAEAQAEKIARDVALGRLRAGRRTTTERTPPKRQ